MVKKRVALGAFCALSAPISALVWWRQAVEGLQIGLFCSSEGGQLGDGVVVHGAGHGIVSQSAIEVDEGLV